MTLLWFRRELLDVQLCFRRFFPEIRGFIVKNWLYIYDSKYCPSLATTFSHLSGSVWIPRRKNWSSFEAIHEFNFLLLHKTGSAGQSGRVPLIETSDSQREQRLENTASVVGIPILTFPSISWPLSQHGVEHCHNAKSLYRVSRCMPFVFQCSAQTHQLRSIPIACDCFSRF